eukprot:scaffold39159_cov54-Attheya_sp.AAC.2
MKQNETASSGSADAPYLLVHFEHCFEHRTKQQLLLTIIMTTGEPAPAPVSSSGKKRMSLIGYAFSPTPDINYNFVLGMYFVGSLLSALLRLCQLALQKDKAEDAVTSSSVSLDEAAVDAAAAPAPTGSLLWGGGLFSLTRESKTELASSLEGMHLVFLPFIPCLLWSFIVRSNWLKQQQQKEQHTHETKKKL